jgi:uncharacterized membrane protein YecN with MAPEG domain
MPPVITALYGALNAILNIYLANRVSSLRVKHKVPLGTVDEGPLLVAIRAHANNAEFMPLAVVMLLLAELCGGHSAALHAIGGSLLLARVAHAFGLPGKPHNPFRYWGTAVTWVGIVGTAGYVLYLRFAITTG